jgi:uncharacterized HAD superfamily protein
MGKTDTRLRVGLDIDGVLADFSGTFIKMANKEFGRNYDPQKQTEWDYECFGLTSTEVNYIWDEKINKVPNWWTKLPTLPNTDHLSRSTERLFFITKRYPTQIGLPMEEQAANWIRKNYFIPNPTVIVTDHKGEVARALRLDAFVDDRIQNCEDVAEHSPDTKVFVQMQPYTINKTFPNIPNSLNFTCCVNHFLKSLGASSGSEERAA